MSTPRVLITADAVGGVWQYAVELAAHLTDEGVRPMIAAMGPPPGADARGTAAAAGVEIIDTGLPLDWLCDDPGIVRQAGAAIGQLAIDRGCDLIHANTPALLAGGSPLPSVAVTHGCIATWWRAARNEPVAAGFAWHKALTADGLQAADQVVSPTQAYADAVAAEYGIATPQAIHNGRSPRPVMQRTVEGAISALTVGRLWDEVKNARFLDRVAARIDLPFAAIGATVGPRGEAVALEHLAAAGPVDEAALAARLAARPIFVSAARFEPFGLAVLEAAQSGCPLILADTPGFRELWDGAALFVPLGDETEWADAVAGLAADTRARALLGEAAEARSRRYTARATAVAMAELYRALLATATERRAA